MARARRARWKLRSGEERIKEYRRGMERKDVPVWHEEKLQDMVQNFRDVATVLSELDQKVRDFCGRNRIDGWKCVNYMRIIRHLWSLAQAGYMKDYERDARYLADKYEIPIDMLNKALEEVGLPKIPGAGGAGILPVP